MSGKGCVLRMHTTSVVDDMQQPTKPLVSTGAKTAGATNTSSTTTNTNTNSGNATTGGVSSSSSPISPATPLNGVNAVTSNSSAGSSAAGNNVAAWAPIHSKIKLPLPPPGTGIRHNVLASAGISAPATGIPRGVVAAAAAVKASPRTAEDIANSARLRKESNAISSNNNNNKPKLSGSPRAATTPSSGKKRPAARPDNKMDEDGDGGASHDSESDSDSMSGSLSDDDSISTSSSFDSEATSDLDDSNSSMSSAASCPQHEQLEDAETVSPDLEYAVIAHRKKGLLLSRLSEVSARGTLAVVSREKGDPADFGSFC